MKRKIGVLEGDLMMKKENAYDFQKKLLQVHEKDVWDHSKVIPEDALLLRGI